MNIKFNSASSCTPKNLAKQLMVDGAKLLNQKQRQALLDIYVTLDQAEKPAQNMSLHHSAAEQHSPNFSQHHEFEDEHNQEYWSGRHCDSYSQEYPEDWVKRTQQRPSLKLSNTAN